MHRPNPAWLVLCVLLPCSALAQASPYVPLDDPNLPLLEHLIATGAVDDPTPFVRPFRRADAARVLRSALENPHHPSDTVLVGRLLAAWTDPDTRTRWRIEGRAGGQGYSHARRDPLHPAGPDGVRPYAELGLEAVLGNLVLATRPAIEPRLSKDPDWPGRHDLSVVGRHVAGYVGAQFRYVDLVYGQFDQQWGPRGVPGLALSAESYPRPFLGFTAGAGGFSLSAEAAQLGDETDSLGQTIHRYFFAHRLAARLGRRWHLALWETSVIAGPDREFDARFRNPVTLLLLANQYGLGDTDANVLVGLDVRWRAAPALLLEAQLAVDDIQYERSDADRPPDRYAFTLAASGRLAGRAGWRALYTQASSLAFRASNQFEGFTDNGVGIGRNFADNDQLSVFVSMPVRNRWLATPEITLLRQGQGRLTDPFPVGAARGDTPALFIGTVQRTWRAALGVAGEEGPVRLSANLGFHHITNAGHQPGRTRDRVEGRAQVTVGFRLQGSFAGGDE